MADILLFQKQYKPKRSSAQSVEKTRPYFFNKNFYRTTKDNFGETIDQKIFHAQIMVDNEKVAAETKAYKPIPIINEFKDDDGNDIMEQQIERNYNRIKRDVLDIIEEEKERIRKDPNLCHLLGEKPEVKEDE